MCGIIAIVSKASGSVQDLVPRIDRLVDVMKHRGPDGRGVFSDEQVILGHRRLAIIDLSDGGHQPMISGNGRFVIVLNGEIYNYPELRTELEKGDVQFRSDSDTEVLLEFWAQSGPSCLPELNGMFGFAVWDRETSSLFAIRDRFGIKPIYYIETERCIALASEIKALLPLLDSYSPNDGAIYDYLMYGQADHTDETFFQEIHRLPAGSYVKVTSEGLIVEKWYDLRQEVAKVQRSSGFSGLSEKHYVKEVKRLFTRAVELRLRSDVPVGSCLSGGIDSSSIVSTARGMIDDSEADIFQTYSAVYGDWFEKDESKYIEALVKKCKVKSNYTRPTELDLNRMFRELMFHQEEPVATASPFAQYCVMKLAHSNGAKVLLDGQGADEILAGYDYSVGYYLGELLRRGRFVKLASESIAQVRRRNKSGLRVALYGMLPKKLRRKRLRRTDPLMNSEFAERFKERNAVEPVRFGPPNLNESLMDEVHYRLQHLLRVEDRNSMAFSIETRVPFLDHNLVAYVLALPPELKIRNGISKYVFRIALGDYLPEIILQRTDKIGFATPDNTWLRSEKSTLIDDLATTQHCYLKRYVDSNRLVSVLKKNKKNLNPKTTSFLFRVVCLQTWLDVHFN